jgi:hypothetical protein
MEGFYIHTVDDGRIIPFEQVELKASDEIAVGQAMLYNGSNAGPFDQLAEKKPTHISMCRRGTSDTNRMISAIRVSSDIEFEVESTANLNLNGEFGVSNDGLTIEAVAVAAVSCGIITNKESLANGSYRYRVRFA